MNFANYATVLLDFTEPAGEIPGKRIEYAAALNTELARASARPSGSMQFFSMPAWL